MKRVLTLAIAAAFAACVAFTGCSSSASSEPAPEPAPAPAAEPTDADLVTEIVVNELEAIKNLDPTFMATMTGSGMEEYGISDEDFAKAMFAGFDYKIGAVDVVDDTATVEVTMTMKSISAFQDNLTNAATEKASEWAGLSDDEIDVKFGELIMQVLGDVQPVELPTVALTLEKVDGVWKYSPGTEEIIAVTVANS